MDKFQNIFSKVSSFLIPTWCHCWLPRQIGFIWVDRNILTKQREKERDRETEGEIWAFKTMSGKNINWDILHWMRQGREEKICKKSIYDVKEISMTGRKGTK